MSAGTISRLALALFAAAGLPPIAAAQPEVALPSALEAGWKGDRVCALLHETETHRVLRCTFPPGVGHERHFHPAHFGYALSGGRMRITDANGMRTVEIPTGSSFSSTGVPWHEGVNVGDTTVAYIMVEEI
ncbi:MAG: cupin domain-containing protein [Alphaproteobacteria bacterium]|nr:MAG: cupin domain-containing protein [Alphaproteobacteria bacterium]